MFFLHKVFLNFFPKVRAPLQISFKLANNFTGDLCFKDWLKRISGASSGCPPKGGPKLAVGQPKSRLKKY